jgi:hypothetical protein
MDNRDKAIALADRYKKIEEEICKAPRRRQMRLIQEAAGIARKMFSIGYSLPVLLRKREERLRHDHQNQR